MNEVLDAVLPNAVHRACLTDGEIAKYVRQNMTRDEAYAVERHLVECDLCRDAVEGAERLSPEETRRHASSLNLRLTEQLNPKRRQGVPGWAYGLAAAAVILVVWGLQFQAPPDPYEQLFDSVFRPYPSIVPQVRGESTPSSVRTALSHYELESYDAAIHELETVLARNPDNELAHFYLSNALLARDRAEPAIGHLRIAANAGNEKIAEPAQWYLALAYLRLGNESLAVPVLQTLSAASGAYSAKADGLLKRLAE